jgi:hypothetical protein
MNSRFLPQFYRPVKKEKEFKRKEIVLKDTGLVTIDISRQGEVIIWIKRK